ncbi:MAG: SIR2 family protein [Culicoidibacterales bacterium]
MSEIQESINYKELLEKTVKAYQDISLICFIGAGVSISQGYPSWDNYINQLINYWAYNLQELVRNSPDRKVDLKDIQLLSSLQHSNESNKRKVDLVNYIVKQYCDTDEIYNQNVLKFEKLMFSEVNPIISINKVLDGLVKLNPIFFTTNYDKQIEQSYSRTRGIDAQTIENFEVFINTDGMNAHTVVHLHGIPETDPEWFISSAQSYKKMYLDGTYRKKFSKMAEEKAQLLIIFVGCSMEEDEVLSLLETQTKNAHFYALMKSTSEYREEINLHKNTIIEKYYKEKHNVNVLFYGPDFSDLPKFIEHFVRDFEGKQNILFNPENIREKLQNITDEKECVLTFNSLLATQDPIEIINIVSNEFLDKPKEEQIQYIEILQKTDLFSEKYFKVLERLINVWILMNENFKDISNQSQEEIVTSISKSILPNIRIEKEMLSIIKQATDGYSDQEKVAFYLKNATQILRSEYLNNQINDDYYTCLWLCEQFEHNMTYVSKEISGIIFNFTKATLVQFIQKIQIFFEKNQFLNYKMLIVQAPVKLLSNIIRNKNLRYQDNQELPDELYECKLIQRILINLDLDENFAIGEFFDLEKLIPKIEWDFRYYGKEMNQFVEKYEIETGQDNEYYRDALIETGCYSIESKPFFTVKPLTSSNEVDSLIQQLTMACEEREWENRIEYTVEEQSKELLRVLNTEEIWDSYREYNKEFIFKIISHTDMIEKYELVIVEFFELGIPKKYIPEVTIKNYLENKFPQGKKTISYLEKRVLQVLVENSNSENDDVYDILFNKIKVELFEEILNTPKYLSINDFTNMGFGRYFDVIFKMNSDIKNYFSVRIKESIDKLPNIYREYLNGKFLLLYQTDELCITIHTFIGYCHNYYVNDNTMDQFKDVALELLNRDDFTDDFTTRNVIYILLHGINPDIKNVLVKTNTPFKEQIILRLLDIFLKDTGELSESYLLGWIKWFCGVEAYIPRIVGTVLLNMKEYNSKTTIIINSLSESIESSRNTGVPGYILTYLDDLEHFTENEFKQVQHLIDILVRKQFLHINSSSLDGIENICTAMKTSGYSEVLKNFIGMLAPRMLAKDLERLKILYL